MSRNRRRGSVLLLAALGLLGAVRAIGGELALPAGWPPGLSEVLFKISVLSDARLDDRTVALGEKLFNDKRLSANDTVACETCHDPARGFVDHKPQAVGINDQKGHRNSPPPSTRCSSAGSPCCAT